MVAERDTFFDPADYINVDFCLLDYHYEELGIIFHSESLRCKIEKCGHEGEVFINELGIFLEETQEKIVIHEPTEIGDEEEIRPLFSYRLPYNVVRAIWIHLDTLKIASLKQEYVI